MIMTDQADLKPVPVRKRTAARLAAIQVDYEVGMTEKSLPDAMSQFLAHYAGDIAEEMQVKKIDEAHFNELSALMADKRDEIDTLIAERLEEGWTIERLARHELSALRAAIIELKYMPHIPAKAVISEYLSLTDAYQGDVKFVNAVIDQVARQLRIAEMSY